MVGIHLKKKNQEMRKTKCEKKKGRGRGASRRCTIHYFHPLFKIKKEGRRLCDVYGAEVVTCVVLGQA